MNQERGQGFLLELPTLRLELPFSPILLNKLFIQTGDGSMAPLEDIAETIGKDQGLTAKVLTMANSAFYGLQSEVRTVNRAVTVLGLNEVRTLILALGVRHIATLHPLPKGFDISAYFEHQLAVGLAAKELAPPSAHPTPRTFSPSASSTTWENSSSPSTAPATGWPSKPWPRPTSSPSTGQKTGIGASTTASWAPWSSNPGICPPNSPNPSTGTTPRPMPRTIGAPP